MNRVKTVALVSFIFYVGLSGAMHAEVSRPNRSTRYESLNYIPESQDPSVTLETRDLVFKIIDNTGLEPPHVESTSYFKMGHPFLPFTHHLGYHGIRTLYDKAERRNIVAPFESWLNLQGAKLEGIASDPVDERACAGFGRGWPMRLERTERGVALQIDPLSRMQMTYRIEFQPAEPDGVDFQIRFKFGRRPAAGPARFSASWPCYTNGWDDVRLFYPRGISPQDWRWASIGEKPNIVIGETVDYQHKQRVYFATEPAFPLAYGRIADRAVILMLNDPGARFLLVDCGGHHFFSTVQNPAWDISWTIEDYPIDQWVGFDGRIVYTRFESPERVWLRYREFSDTHPAPGIGE